MIGTLIYNGLSRPRPYGVQIIATWTGYASASPPVAVLTIFLMGVIYCLAVPGRPRSYTKAAVVAVVALFSFARLYLGVDHPGDVLLGATFAVAIAVTAFRFFTPNEAFPVVYRRGRSAHVDVTGQRGEAIRRAVRDQLGLNVAEIKPVGLESSAGSTPLRLRVEGSPDEFLFAKLYTKGHVRADRWYKLGRTLLYGSLEDESPFKTVRRLVTYEDYALRLLQDIGVRTARPYGVVEITPEREYLMVTEFFSGAVEIGEAHVDDAVIDQGLLLIRTLWDAGIAHRDIKPGNLMVRSGELLLIDVAFVQVRPSPWRQAVDLGNMMLVLAVRTDPHRVYQRALRYFTPAELAEAFAATRGVASPTQLRAFMKRDPRDLLGEFRALAPQRRPIVLQRWSVGRIALVAAVLAVTVVAVNLVYQTFFPFNLGASPPSCGTGHSMILSAQAVPSAATLPCVAALPSGWSIGRADISSGRSSDVAGLRSRRHARGHRNPHRGMRHLGRRADTLRPAGHAQIRAAAEPRAAIFRPSLLHISRRLCHLRFPLQTRSLPGPCRRRRQRAGVPAPVNARRLHTPHRGSCPVRARCRVPGMSREASAAPIALQRSCTVAGRCHRAPHVTHSDAAIAIDHRPPRRLSGRSSQPSASVYGLPHAYRRLQVSEPGLARARAADWTGVFRRLL